MVKSAPLYLLTKSDIGGTLISVCVSIRRDHMKKKAVAILLSLTVALNVFTGCGNSIEGHEPDQISAGDSSSEQQPDTSNPDDKNTIVNPYDDSNQEYNGKVDTTIDYLKADNMKYYYERMVVGGDSIAFGWQYYGLLPKQRVIAQGGLSTFGFTVWEFETTGQKLGYKQTLKKVRPTLLYLCLGMNDVNIRSADEVVKQYTDLLKSILSVVPDCLVVVQSITPVCKTNVYKQVNNASVKKYNAKLREMIASLGKENIVYFNAYNSLLGDDGYMDPKYDGGDGLHINTAAYKKLLEDLSNRLNMEMAQQRIEIYEQERKKKQQ